jgi:putative flippase GtrA
MTALHPPHPAGSGIAWASLLRSPGAVRQGIRFGAIGLVSTAAYVGLYAILRNIAPAAAASAVALAITAAGNTAANRRLTFEVQGKEGLARHHAAGILALAVALSITSASLGILQAIAPHHGRLTEIATLVAANAAATIVRFLLLRLAIDGARSIEVAGEHDPVPAALSPASLSALRRTRG